MTRNRIARKVLSAFTSCVLLLSSGLQSARACTGIRLIVADGTVVHARTLEFGVDLLSDVIVVPRGYARIGSTPDGKEGLKWRAKYASVGANGLGMPLIFDGLNERGLAIGLFYFPTTAGYMPYNAADAGKTIAPWEMGSWMLDNFATVAEVKANASKIVVAEVVFKGWGFVPPVHFVVHDASGKSIVIEYVGGKLIATISMKGDEVIKSLTPSWAGNSLPRTR